MASRREVVRGLFAAAGGVALARPAAAAGAVSVPMEVQYEATWVSWVAATTGCLKALGFAGDLVDVSGLSGYAFVMNMHPQVQPSGPTAFRRSILTDALPFLGRSLRVFEGGLGHTSDAADGQTRQHCRDAFDMAAAEVAAGRPCVLWGAYSPEYAIVYGVEEERYLVRSSRRYTNQPEPPVPFEAIDAPASVYLLTFPSPVTRSQADADRFAIGNAAWILSQPSFNGDHILGIEGYDAWAEAVERGTADPLGNAYCAGCYADLRSHAAQFLARVAARNPEPAEALKRASEAYQRAHTALKRLGEVFPFPAGDEMGVQAKRSEGAAAVLAARDAEVEAISALRQAQAMPWGVA
jgi:hypothetical protein